MDHSISITKQLAKIDLLLIRFCCWPPLASSFARHPMPPAFDLVSIPLMHHRFCCRAWFLPGSCSSRTLPSHDSLSSPWSSLRVLGLLRGRGPRAAALVVHGHDLLLLPVLCLLGHGLGSTLPCWGSHWNGGARWARRHGSSWCPDSIRGDSRVVERVLRLIRFERIGGDYGD
jgi:hypothetical protein